MTWVKICGTTNLEDALLAVEAGADALGFVFYEKSPRRVEVKTAREIVRGLPERVEKVGVFVDQSAARIREIMAHARLTVAQLHGEATVASIVASGGTMRKAIAADKLIFVVPGEKVSDEGFLLSGAMKKEAFALLLDAGAGSVLGGTGRTFNWEKASGAVQALSFIVPVIVAGGLSPGNVREAVRLFQPFGVDVASGVETAPGQKDPEKVREFVLAVRQARKSA